MPALDRLTRARGGSRIPDPPIQRSKDVPACPPCRSGLESLIHRLALLNIMEGQPTNQTVIAEDQIRGRAYRLAKDHPWRSPIENWRDAENQLNNESRHKIFFLIWKPLCNAAKWAFASDKKGLDFFTGLSIPILLAAGGWWISGLNDRRQENIASNAQRDLVLVKYLEDMKPYIIDKQKDSPREWRYWVQPLTETAFERLSMTDLYGKPLASKQKGAVIGFLYRKGLIENTSGGKIKKRFISFQKVNLSGADLTLRQLAGANFKGADLRGAILRNSDLANTSLRMSQLQGADLQGAELSGADLRGSDKPPSKLSNSQEYYTNLCGAKLDESVIKKLVESKKVKSNAQTIWPSSPSCANSG